MKLVAYAELTAIQRAALDAAEEVLQQSYNPYSNFAVGAALVSAEGTIITGTNFENAAYGSTLCAERAAVVRANSQGIREFETLGLIGRCLKPDPERPPDPTKPIAPCGSCRQVLFELAQMTDSQLTLVLSSPDKSTIRLATIDELLPHGFGPKDLGLDLSRFAPGRS